MPTSDITGCFQEHMSMILLHSYVGPYDTPILVRMSRSEVPTACYQAKAQNVCFYAFIDSHLQWTTAVVYIMLPVLSLIANIRG